MCVGPLTPTPDCYSGWVLLALAVALVNASSGIIILYIILTAIGWVVALWFIGRPVLVWLCRATGSYGENGPTLTMTTAVLFLVLTSAWVTDRIGIHAIFGGFVAGLIIPYEIRAPLTEKIEDLVASLFLPIVRLTQLLTGPTLADSGCWSAVLCPVRTEDQPRPPIGRFDLGLDLLRHLCRVLLKVLVVRSDGQAQRSKLARERRGRFADGLQRSGRGKQPTRPSLEPVKQLI